MKFRAGIKTKVVFIAISVLAQFISLVANWMIFRDMEQKVISELAYILSYNSIFAVVVFFRNDVRLTVQRDVESAKATKDLAVLFFLITCSIYYAFLVIIKVTSPLLVLTLAGMQALVLLSNSVLTFFSDWAGLASVKIVYSLSLLLLVYFNFSYSYTSYLLTVAAASIPPLIMAVILRYPFFLSFHYSKVVSRFSYDKKEVLQFGLSSTPLSFLNSYVLQGPIFLLGGNPKLLASYFLFNKFIVTPLAATISPLTSIWTRRFVKKEGLSPYYSKLFRCFIVVGVMLYFIMMLTAFIYEASFQAQLSSYLYWFLVFYTPTAFWQIWVSSMSNVIPAQKSLQLEVRWKLPAFILIFILVRLDVFMDIGNVTTIVLLSILYFLLYTAFYQTFRGLFRG